MKGEATVIEDDGEQVICPDDAACWPAGTANAHTVFNHTKEPCSYLICGSRQTLYIEGKDRRVQDADGKLIKEGVERSLGEWLKHFSKPLIGPCFD